LEEYRKYLQPAVVSRLGTIELKAKMIVEGFITGLHKSPYHGFSVEFAEHRQYTFGDEPRHIDWRVYAERASITSSSMKKKPICAATFCSMSPAPCRFHLPKTFCQKSSMPATWQQH